jgi:diguanylate cyclase (GGDEF)-like protein
MDPLSWYRNRVRRRTDSEHSQALLRTVIVWMLLGYTVWVAGHEAQVADRLWTINLLAAVLSPALFAHVLWRPGKSPARRIVGALHDNIFVTLWLFNAGPMGALGLFVYPFVTVGNGFRFGVRYLAWSGFLGALGIGAIVVSGRGWATHSVIGAGILLSHTVVTVYTGILLRQLHQTREQLERIATYDVLTGLPNRRFFMDQLTQIMAADNRPGLACLYLDLDGFKAVNDRWGHKTGDQLLHMVARELLSCIGATDTLARLGGDEFTVVLIGLTDPVESRVIADHIIRRVQSLTDVDGCAIDISVSVGISYLPAGPMPRRANCDELLKLADDAMYIAKRSGRGNCRTANIAA